MAVSGERRLFPSSWREGEAVVFRKELSYGEAEQRAYLPTRQSPPKPGRAVFGSREHARGRGIDGPTEGSLRPKAVERSADRRRAVDSPFHPQKKESPLPPRARHSGGGPSIPLPFQTPKKRSRHPRQLEGP